MPAADGSFQYLIMASSLVRGALINRQLCHMTDLQACAAVAVTA